jgi:hypothetical protein
LAGQLSLRVRDQSTNSVRTLVNNTQVVVDRLGNREISKPWVLIGGGREPNVE